MYPKIQRYHFGNHLSFGNIRVYNIDSTNSYHEITIFIVTYLTAHQYTGFICSLNMNILKNSSGIFKTVRHLLVRKMVLLPIYPMRRFYFERGGVMKE